MKYSRNILSSLIANFETVEEVITTSMNSSGSAMAENEKYMQSIQGRIDAFNNALQTFWNNLISSDVIKTVVDSGTTLIELLDTGYGKILAFLAALKTAAKMKGFSFAGVAQSIGNQVQEITKAQNIIKSLQGAGITPGSAKFNTDGIQQYAIAVSNLTAKQQAAVLSSANLSKQQIITAMRMNGVEEAAIREATAHKLNTQAEVQSTEAKNLMMAASLKSQADSASGAAQSAKSAAAAYLEAHAQEELTKELIEQAIARGELTREAGEQILGQMSGASGLLGGIGTFLKTNWVSVLISLIPVAIGLISKLAKRNEKLHQEVSELTKEYQNQKKTIDDNLKSLTTSSDTDTYATLEDEFVKLAQGVDKNGNNMSLTADEYERYREICETICGINPNLAAGYDDVTEAIGNNASVLSQLIELQKEEAQQEAKEYVKTDNFKKIAKDAINDYEDLETELFNISGDIIGEIADQFAVFESDNPFMDNVANMLESMSIDDQLKNQLIGELEDYNTLGTGDFNWEQWIADNIDFLETNIKQLPSEIAELVEEYSNTSTELDAAKNNMMYALLQVPMSMDEYLEFDDTEQSFITNWIKNSGAFEIDEDTTTAQILEWKAQIKNMVRELANEDYTYTLPSGNVVSAQDILDTIYNIDPSKVNWEQYKKDIEELYNYLWQSVGAEKNTLGKDGTPLTSEELLTMFGLPSLDDKQFNEMIKRIEMLSKQTGYEIVEHAGQSIQEYISSLDALEVQRLLKINWNLVDEDNFESIMTGVMAQDFTVANFADYASSIESITENISTLQSAYESLMSGDFTYEDFLELIQQFPELAEGVDTSSDSFDGLAKNLHKAIKNAPDDLVDELKDLRTQLVKAGKSTDAIDQLIDSMENLPTGKVDELAEKYVTLADAINDANSAQGELAKAMGENPNSNYENTSEAVQKMRDMYANGAYGSESEIWDIFEALTGQTYDFSKSLTENGNILKDWINTYSDFYLRKEGDQEDGEYAHKPIEKFLNFMEAKVKEAKEAGEEWALATTWSYENGTVDIDYDNRYLEELAKSAGLTEAAFHDLMMQVAQFWAMEWEDADDIVYYMDEVLKSAEESGKNADDILEDLAGAMDYFNKGDVDLLNRPVVPYDEENFGSWKEYYQQIVNNVEEAEEYRKWAQGEIDAINDGTWTATVFSNAFYKSELLGLGEGESDSAIVLTPILPDGTVLSPEELKGYARKILSGTEIDVDGITLGIFKGENVADEVDEFKQKLHEAQDIYYSAVERFSAKNILSQIDDGGIEVLDQIGELSTSLSKGASGEVFIDTTSLIATLTEAQYTEDAIVDVIDKLKELGNVTLYDEESDPFGLYKATSSAEDMVAALDNAGVAVKKTFSHNRGAAGGAYIYNIDVREMSEVLASRGWTTNDIVSYINSATGSYGDGDIFANMSVNVDTTDIDVALGKVDTLPEDANTDYTIDVSPTFDAINDEWAKLTEDKKVDYIVNKKTIYSWGWDFANGTAHARGTAFAGGNWGASRTETALVGELGPEMVVRGNRWFTVGDSGAEFTDIKKGDIIFNHKQTEDLLSKGHITGRGKAYASGTAYSSTDGTNDFEDNADDIGYKGDFSHKLSHFVATKL